MHLQRHLKHHHVSICLLLMPSFPRYPHTSTRVVRVLLCPQRRRLDVLALARNLRSLGVILDHVPRATAAGGIDILLDCRGDEVARCSG